MSFVAPDIIHHFNSCMRLKINLHFCFGIYGLARECTVAFVNLVNPPSKQCHSNYSEH